MAGWNPLQTDVQTPWDVALRESWSVDWNKANVTASIGIGRHSARLDLSVPAFLAWADVICADDFLPENVKPSGTGEIDDDEMNILSSFNIYDEKIDKDNPDKVLPVLSFFGTRNDRAVILALSDAEFLFGDKIAKFRAMRASNDPVKAMMMTFAGPKDDDVFGKIWSFRISFEKSSRALRIPVNMWAEFVRQLDFMRNAIRDYQRANAIKILEKPIENPAQVAAPNVSNGINPGKPTVKRREADASGKVHGRA